ncbi:HAD family hydrolase [bacterium]|nr:HAD family hydrolase [bacterium]
MLLLLLSLGIMIRLITFDFWNTLFVDRGEEIRNDMRKEFAFSRLQKYKPDLTKDELNAAFEVARIDFELQWRRYTTSTMNKYVQVVCNELGIAISQNDQEEIVGFFETVLLQHQPLLIPNAGDAVKNAKARLKVGLISDTGYSPGTTLRKIMGNHGIESYFDSFSFSNETGYLKPRLESFLRILYDLKIRPEEAVHIGDLEHTDIAGAKRIGLKAIKFIGANHLATRESMADVVIDDIAELPVALEKLQYNGMK